MSSGTNSFLLHEREVRESRGHEDPNGLVFLGCRVVPHPLMCVFPGGEDVGDCFSLEPRFHRILRGTKMMKGREGWNFVNLESCDHRCGLSNTIRGRETVKYCFRQFQTRFTYRNIHFGVHVGGEVPYQGVHIRHVYFVVEVGRDAEVRSGVQGQGQPFAPAIVSYATGSCR